MAANPEMTLDEMGCYIFAMSGTQTEHFRDIQRSFDEVTNGMLLALDPYMDGLEHIDLTVDQRDAARTTVMEQLQARRDDTVLEAPGIYLCGCFEDNAIAPIHMWIEDRENNVTYDTFPGTDGICRVEGHSGDGGNFRPGCESEAWEAEHIMSVPVSGFTQAQLQVLLEGTVLDADDDDVELDHQDVVDSLPNGAVAALAAIDLDPAEEQPEEDPTPAAPGANT